MEEYKSYVREPIKVEELVGNGDGDKDKYKPYIRGNEKLSDSPVLKHATPFNSEYFTYTPGLDKLMNINPDANYIPGTEIDNQKLYNNQSLSQKIDRAGDQFFTNLVSAFGQGLANALDITGWGNQDFTSSLFGISTKDMQEWANNRQKYQNQIITKREDGGIDLSDAGWWLNQFASSGTGVGMAGFSALETVAIEAATGGLGTGAALARLGNLFKNIRKARGAEAVLETANLTNQMRSAAGVYATLSRLNEGRMEAMNSYSEIAEELRDTGKYSEEEIAKLSHEGAKKTFLWNMALLPLDILSFRAMVYNPVSGASEGWLERQLAGVTKRLGESKVSKAIGWGLTKGIGVLSEGVEEGFQHIVADEGNHYAKVLGGLDDNSTFLERVGKNLQSDDFWNEFAGGVLGAPIIGGIMNLTQGAANRQRSKYLNTIHSDFIKSIGQIDSEVSNTILKLDKEGKHEEANDIRKQFFRDKVLSSLHLDAMTDKDTGYNSMYSFLEDTLNNASSNKGDSLYDLGFDPDNANSQNSFIKSEFPSLIKEAEEMKDIYDQAKNVYNANILPTAVNTKFNLLQYEKQLANINGQINTAIAANTDYAGLSTQGKRVFDIGHNLDSLDFNKKNLENEIKNAKKSGLEEEEISNLERTLSTVNTKIGVLKNELSSINQDENYSVENREQDNDIIGAMINQDQYKSLINDKNVLEAKLVFNRKQLGLLNKPDFIKKLDKKVIEKGTKTNVAQVKDRNPEVAEQVKEKENKETSDNLIKSQQPVISTPIKTQTLFEEPKDMDEAFSNVSTIMDKGELNTKVEDDLDDGILLKTFAPKSISSLSDEDKANLARGVNISMSNLPEDQQTFRDLAQAFKDKRGIDALDNYFNGLIVGWEESGRTPLQDYGLIHKELTSSLETGFDMISNTVDSIEELDAETDKTNDHLEEIGEIPDTTDDNNQPVVVESSNTNPNKVVEAKLAFTNAVGKWVVVEVDGKTEVQFQRSSDDIVFGEFINSKPVLHPDKFREGTKLRVAIPNNYKDIPVAIFSPTTGEKTEAKAFGIVAANMEEGSQEWLDKVPMIVYEEGNPVGVAFIHDSNWYNVFSQNTGSKDAIEGKKKTRELRKAIYDNYLKNLDTTVVVTSKTETNLNDLRLPEGHTIPLSEGNPQAEFVKAVNNTLTKEGKAVTHTDSVIIESSPKRNGQYYTLVRYGMSKGKPSYLLQKIFPQQVNNNPDNVKTLKIFGAILSKLHSNENFKKAAEEIRKQTGFDITKSGGVVDFLKQFIPVQSTEGLNKRSPEENIIAARNYINNGRNSLKGGDKYVAVTAAGQIIFGRKGGDAKIVNSVNSADEFGEFVKDMQQNISDNSIRKELTGSSQFVQLNTTDNKTVDVLPKGKYTDYLKTQIHTNIKSINIGTEDKPYYVTQLQPTINIALEGDITPKYESATEIIKEAIPQEVETESEEVTPEQEYDNLFNNLDDLGVDLNDDSILAPRTLSEADRRVVARSINKVAGLEPNEQSNLENFIYQQAIIEVKGKEIKRGELKSLIGRKLDDLLDIKLNALIAKLDQVNQFTQKNTNLPENKLTELNKLTRGLNNQIDKINNIKNNYNALYTNVSNRLEVNEYITSQNDDFNIDDYMDESYDEENIATGREFSEDSLRVNPYLKLTNKLKFLFEGIPDTDNKGENLKGIFGLPKYKDSDQLLRFIQAKLVNNKAEYDTLLNLMKSLVTSKPWIQEVINRLEASTQQDKNLFVKAMSNHLLTPKFGLISFNRKTKRWDTKVLDSHLNGLDDTILKSWKNNLYTDTDIISYNNGVYNINKEAIDNLIDEIDSLKTISDSPESIIKIQDTLKKLGIDLSTDTVKDIRREGMYLNFNKLNWEQLFTSADGFFRVLNKELSTFDKEKISENIIPLDNSIFKTLAKMESKYNEGQNTLNFRDGDKAYYGLIVPRFVGDRHLDLTSQQSKTRELLRSLPFSQSSLLLNLLDNSDKFRQQHKINNIGNTAFKQNGKPNIGDMSITNLSPVDHELLKIGMFTDTRQGKVEYKINGIGVNTYPNTNIELRMASMMMPSLADKSQALYSTQAVLDFTPADFNNGTELSSEALKVVYEQAVKPDLLRMIASAGQTSNIDGYEEAKHLFTIFPKLNYLAITDDLLLIDHIKNNGGKIGLRIEDIENDPILMKGINDIISEIILAQAENKKQEWIASNITPTNGDNVDFSKINIKYIDKYTKGNTPTEALNMFALDYVINNIIANTNTFMAYSGDPALYYKSKAPKDNYVKRMMDTYDNMNKRLASLIAPAAHYPNGDSQKYYQLFLQDKTTVPDKGFLKFITKLHHGTEITDEEIDLLNNGDKSIADKYPKASAYFSIDSTDAQEYTTWKEHLNVLENYGVVSDAVNGITQEDINKARALFTENKDRSKLTEGEMELIKKVMQPIKPRYVGDYEQDGVMRRVYIKTSSFPLIPQLTKGFEIDNLRKLMENKEKEGYNVRASYHSGNKVGAVTKGNALKVWNNDGSFRKEAMDEVSDQNSLLLDRNGWGIQQDVPFKSEKTKEDRIRMTTQLTKLLFGDGLMDLDGFEFEGAKHTGKELQKIYTDLFSNLIDTRWVNFNKKLGLSQSGQVVDKTTTAKRLSKLLKSEATRRNYPLNDIIGLDVDENGNFNLPLWASNNSNRYESLLNSIVESALVKIKFPGYSYVAGSSEGFISPKVQEEQDFTNSEVVYTKHWNGSHLEMTTTSNGVVDKAQVFIPSKFRDKNGDLVDLFARNKEGYIYIDKNEDGSIILKNDMIEDELLNIISIRIPTSSIGSAATIEIAGFLPFTSGDLIIVPTEFTKQKGMDFDVDKEYTYHYWHTVEPNGKIKKIDSLYKAESLESILSDLRDIRKEYQKELSKHQNMSSRISELEDEIEVLEGMEVEPFEDIVKRVEYLKNNLPSNPDATIAALISIKEQIDTLESHKEKVIQNRIINLMQSVLNNPNPEVQAKINNALSIDFAKEQADIIDSINTKEDSNFTGASDMYQKKQFLNGVSGKIGTGAYSLDVVFHSLTQQAARNDNPITLMYRGEEEYIPKSWRFGDIESNPILGQQMTQDGDRTITEVNSEQQNISVDNGKEKVLGKVNINNLTMDVDKIFNLTGLDKGDKVYIKDGDIISSDTAKNTEGVQEFSKISYAFLSQPIIKDYVEAMQNSKSAIADFVKDKDKVIVRNLIDKYYPNFDPDDADLYDSQMSVSNMMQELTKDVPNGELQAAILYRFLDMKKYGETLRKIQGAINVDSKGLDKSFFNTIEKLKTISDLGSIQIVDNSSALIGEYNGDITPDTLILPTGVTIRPTTVSGKIGLYGLVSSYNLLNTFLPYDSVGMSYIFDQILSETLKNTDIESTVIDQKQEILREFKKFLAVKEGNGVINSSDIESYRKSLYIDTEENVSLATYIKKLLEFKDNPIINKFIKSNALINRFEFDNVRELGKPSVIKFNNTVGDAYNEQELYNSFANLLSVNYPLPKIGNKQYSTDELAQALIDYAHLGNAIQEAIQFTKYIPTVYYDVTGYTDFMKQVHNSLVDNNDELNIFNRSNNSVATGFTIQYLQHNPSKVKTKLPSQVSELNKKIFNTNEDYKNKIERLKYFSLREEGTEYPNFISIYNPALVGDTKQQLYIRKEGTTSYYRIPILGTFGMDEYNPSKLVGKSIINDTVNIKTPTKWFTSAKPYNENDIFGAKSESIQQIINNIAKEDSIFGTIAAEILPYVGDNINFNVTNILSDGEYIKSTNTINISEALMATGDKNKIAKTIVHETIHALTATQIDNYIIREADMKYQVKANAPKYVSDLIRLYNVAVKTIGAHNIQNVIDRLRSDQGTLLNPADREITYGGVSIYEFISLTLTEPSFQKTMNEVELPTKETLFTRFVNILKELLNSLGANFKKGSLQEAAFVKSFELITSENPIQDNLLSPSTTNLINELNSLEDIDDLEARYNDEIGENLLLNPFECI